MAIPVFREIPALRAWRRKLLLEGKTLGFVPTMGALHAGHLSLIRAAASENDEVIVSIYLNPLQFGASEDLDSYPKTWSSDMAALDSLNEELPGGKKKISAVFAPVTSTMYPTLPPTSDPAGDGSFVTITPLGTKLEGASRPVFFRGVTTVCMKLFNIVTPERVYFGQKDVQQTIVIRRMVRDFCMDLDVRVIPTERDEGDDIALSSRNVYLGARRRKVATVLPRALRMVERTWTGGNGPRGRGRGRGRDEVIGEARKLIQDELDRQERLEQRKAAKFELVYLSLAHPDELDELDIVDPRVGAVVSAAIKMAPLEQRQAGEDAGLGDGEVPVRLIDNVILRPQENV